MPIEVLTPNTANDRFVTCLKKYGKVICLYHWNFCGHCIDFKPVWDSVINFHKDKINVIEIELESMKKFKDDKYKVMGFPSIVVYQNGVRTAEFTKQRNAQNLHEFIVSHFHSPVATKPVTKPATKSATKPKKLKKPTK